MKPETARQHNAPQVGESELRPKSDKVRFFEGMMTEFGYKIVDVTPPPNFTAKVMRRIRAKRKASN